MLIELPLTSWLPGISKVSSPVAFHSLAVLHTVRAMWEPDLESERHILRSFFGLSAPLEAALSACANAGTASEPAARASKMLKVFMKSLPKRDCRIAKFLAPR